MHIPAIFTLIWLSTRRFGDLRSRCSTGGLRECKYLRHVCMYVCMHVCMYRRTVGVQVSAACSYACVHVCMYRRAEGVQVSAACMHICMYVLMPRYVLMPYPMPLAAFGVICLHIYHENSYLCTNLQMHTHYDALPHASSRIQCHLSAYLPW